VETAGADDEVVKLLCPLVISEAELLRGLDILDTAIGRVLSASSRKPAAAAAAASRNGARQNGAAL
jgi:diaminobutyrate-2-oxoglutarate transaminase